MTGDVTAVLDKNNNTSLRAVIEYGNQAGKIITGAFATNHYDITFTAGGAITLDNALSTLAPKSNLQITAPEDGVTIQRDPEGNGQFRLLDLVAGTETHLFQLTLAHGWSGAGGGAIFNEGKLQVEACSFSNNHANASGGAISSNGVGAQLTVSNSSFWYNEAWRGGAIAAVNTSLVSITNTDIFSNSAVTFAGNLGLGGGLFFQRSARGLEGSVLRV